MTIMMQRQVNLYVQSLFLLGWSFSFRFLHLSLVVMVFLPESFTKCYFFSLFPFFSSVKILFYLNKMFDYLNYPAMMFC
ncbi:uncharacterized protein BX664DRAFT_341299, partial [Halteromyces radiatus]|uniref:uncharacterized protein n=1 Tax=Halteromyces radiatus TaxID=101107 RepID=UPI00221EB1BE